MSIKTPCSGTFIDSGLANEYCHVFPNRNEAYFDRGQGSNWAQNSYTNRETATGKCMLRQGNGHYIPIYLLMVPTKVIKSYK